MKKNLKINAGRGQRGIVLIFFAILLLILIGFCGLVIDTGLACLVSNQLQAGADAAALAGAQFVRTDMDRARTAAKDIALANTAGNLAVQLRLNTANAGDGDIVVGRFQRSTRTFTPQLTNRNAVKVNARRTAGSLAGPQPLLFGPVFNMANVNIQGTAIAMVGGGTGNGMLILDESDPKSLYIRGSAVVNVNGGDIQVNSSNAEGAYLQGSKIILNAPSLNVVGDAFIAAGADIGDTEVNPGSPPMDDPLAYMPDPAWNPAHDLGTVKVTGGTHSFAPGYYSGGMTFSGGNTTLQPGIYILGGAGFNISGNTNLTAQGVMIYLDAGTVNINGTGQVLMRAPDTAQDSFPGVDTYEGLLFFQARDNTTTGMINGTSGLDLTGTLYFPKNKMNLSGTSDKVGNQIVAYKLEFAGNSNLTINYNGNFPAPGNRVFLVK